MVPTCEEAPPGSRFSDLKSAFQSSVRPLLTAFSKEDVYKAFPTFSNNEKEELYLLFVRVIKSLHEKIEEEFLAICQESQVDAKMDAVEQLIEEQSLDQLPTLELDAEEIKKILSQVKRDEINYLSSLLEKAERQNELVKARVESLKRARDDTDATTDAMCKLRSWNSNYEKLLNG